MHTPRLSSFLPVLLGLAVFVLPAPTQAKPPLHVDRAPNCDKGGKEQVVWAKEAKELKCELAGPGWSTNAKINADRCKTMSMKEWTEDSFRRANLLKRCKEIHAQRAKNDVSVIKDVNVHAKPDGNSPIRGILRENRTARASCFAEGTKGAGWCYVWGDAVPSGNGYAWNSFLKFINQ